MSVLHHSSAIQFSLTDCSSVVGQMAMALKLRPAVTVLLLAMVAMLVILPHLAGATGSPGSSSGGKKGGGDMFGAPVRRNSWRHHLPPVIVMCSTYMILLDNSEFVC
jgi:hypothetical protein